MRNSLILLRRQRAQSIFNVGLTYSLPVLPFYFLFGPITILQGIYAKYFGLSLTTIASVLFIARLFDAVADPFVGYCADRYYSQNGNRTPFILCGGVLFIIASWFLYVPPSNVSSGYFLSWFLVFYFAYTLFEIPHLAWGSELASSSEQKNKIYGIRSFFMFVGTLLFFATPLLPVFENNEFTPETLKWSVLLASALMLPLLYLGTKNVCKSSRWDEHRVSQQKKLYLGGIFKAVFLNKPLLTLSAAHICSGFGWGMWLTMLFLYADIYLNLGGQFALVYTFSFSFSIFALGAWYFLAAKWGKQSTWIAGMSLVLLGLISTSMFSPTDQSWVPLLVCMTLIFSGIAAYNIIVPSLLSDIVDYGRWKFGRDNAATYFSLYTFINKAVAALGGALGLGIAGWYGFDPTSSSQSASSIAGLHLVIAYIPAVMIFLSIFFIAHIPITGRRHAVIRRRLDARLEKPTNVAVDTKINPFGS